MKTTMKAVLLHKTTEAGDVTLCEIPIPEVKPGWVLVFGFLDKHRVKPVIGASFAFEHIKDACAALDSGSVNGKIVVSTNRHC